MKLNPPIKEMNKEIGFVGLIKYFTYHFRLCHQADTRDILRSLEKQVGVLHQSLQRVSSSSEQFGAVQQEGKVATAVEIVLLHVENLKRSYEKEHNELEDARRILIEHKLLGIKS